jgi:hypothetical protein
MSAHVTFTLPVFTLPKHGSTSCIRSDAFRRVNTSIVVSAGLAARAELGWRDRVGHLHAIAITPLVIDGTVVAALPFDQTSSAQRLVDATDAVLVLSDSRMALRGWTPWMQPVRPEVTADREGSWTWTGALDQEVRKYPPSRLLIDTAIQRRAHWWYVPRWLVRLPPVGTASPVTRRSGPHDAVLFEVLDGRMRATTVAIADWRAPEITLNALHPDVGADDGPVPALAFTHDFSIPDMERQSRCEAVGIRHRNVLAVETRQGSALLQAPEGLIRRLSRHWRRERDCRRALAAYDTGSSLAAT